MAVGGNGLLIEGQNPNRDYPLEDLKVSWQVHNTGQWNIDQPFAIELRLDGTVVAQWLAEELPTRTFLFVEAVTGLFDGVNIEPGPHQIELVVDPLDSINEVVELDNNRIQTLDIVDIPARSGATPRLLPNLAIALPSGKTEPIFVSSHPDDPLSGKLSVDAPSHIKYGAGNRSIYYIEQNVEIDLYLDGNLVRRATFENLGADEPIFFKIDDLHELIDIAPGPHTLRVVVDPLDRIHESDETDNEFEAEFVWGVGDPPSPAEIIELEAPAREPLTRANLMPFRPFGWDSGITAQVDNALLRPGQDGWLESGKVTRIDFAFTNASRFSLPLTDQLAADVLFDGKLIDRRFFDSGTSNVGTNWEGHAVVPASLATPGQHTIRVILDPDGLFEELNESDNIYERTFTWNDGPDPGEVPFEMSEAELQSAFAPIFNEWRRELRPVRGPGAPERDWTPELMAAGRAAYYLLTGRDLNTEGYVLHFESERVFEDESTAACMSNWITMGVSQYQEAFDFCTGDRGEIGFKTRSNGQVHLFVDLGLSPLDALGTYLHELAHGLQDLRNREQTELPFSIQKRGLLEGQAQIFEAAGWRAIEEFMGEELDLFPDVASARDRFDQVYELRRNRGTEHDVGYRLLWTEALSDPSGIGFADRLRSGETLDSAFAYALFNILVNIPADEVEAWADALLERTDLMDEFQQIASERFTTDLPAESVGHTALRDATWTAP